MKKKDEIIIELREVANEFRENASEAIFELHKAMELIALQRNYIQILEEQVAYYETLKLKLWN